MVTGVVASVILEPTIRPYGDAKHVDTPSQIAGTTQVSGQPNDGASTILPAAVTPLPELCERCAANEEIALHPTQEETSGFLLVDDPTSGQSGFSPPRDIGIFLDVDAPDLTVTRKQPKHSPSYSNFHIGVDTDLHTIDARKTAANAAEFLDVESPGGTSSEYNRSPKNDPFRPVD